MVLSSSKDGVEAVGNGEDEGVSERDGDDEEGMGVEEIGLCV